MISFQNPGEIDPRLITTMGTNVKESENPIGFFGTGLKYAIAVALRERQEIVIWSGTTRYDFELEKDSIRGKEFEFIIMRENGVAPQRLAFTTEFGKKWELWKAYRELYCNAKDEGGEVFDYELSPVPEMTLVKVTGEKFQQVHRDRGGFMITSAPLWNSAECDLHPPGHKALFYRGNKVMDLLKPSVFTYNLQTEMELTEDRTLKSFWDGTIRIAQASMACPDPEICRMIANAPKGTFEHEMEYNWSSVEMGEVFEREFRAAMLRDPSEVNQTLKAKYLAKHPHVEVPPETELTVVEGKSLVKAMEFCLRVGVPISARVHVADSLGAGDKLGAVIGDEIWLSRRAFMIGTKCVAGTLIEEQVHITTRHGDMTRSLQNWLVDKIVSLGEELIGEPL